MRAARELLEREFTEVAAEIGRTHRESLRLMRQLRENDTAFDALLKTQRELHEALAPMAASPEEPS